MHADLRLFCSLYTSQVILFSTHPCSSVLEKVDFKFFFLNKQITGKTKGS